MAKWNINRNGPQWLMDGIGRVLGYRDDRGGEYKIPQVSGAWGDAEALSSPAAGVTTDPLTGGVTTIAKLTQAQYDALAVKDPSTLYVIVG